MSPVSVWRIERVCTRQSIATLGVAVLVTWLLVDPTTDALENCCTRQVYTAPFSMPAGDSERWSRFASGDAISPLFDGVLQGTDCPLRVWLTGRQADQDYRFEGAVTTEGLVQTDEYGNLHGNFIARLRLIDPDHGNAVLREAEVKWSGTLTDGFNHRVYHYEPSQDALSPSWLDRTGELGRQFFDIQDLIYNYEGKPQQCAVTMPEGIESIESGETITIQLTDIVDHQGRRPPAWQRVLVKVEKGTILNAVEKWNELYVFKVGASGDVVVQYKAPEDCKPATETLTVWNTCTKKEDGSYTGADVQLASRQFDIDCDQWDVAITYTEDVEGEEREGDKKRTVSRHYAATFKARVRLAEADSQRSLYRSEDCSIELHDNYTWHYVDNECNHRGGFAGEKGGRIPLSIEVQFNPGSERYYFRFDPPSEVISYKFAGQLLGPDPHCTGAWEYEAPSSRSVLPAGWEEAIGQRQYTPGQTRITGDAILDKGMTGVWPDNPQMFEPSMRGDMFQAIFMMNAQIGGYSPLVILNAPIKQTLTWEIKRPE
jgi:hypothetical protein